MESVFHGFDVNGSTWFYLSLLLIVSVFFRFGRIWSLRNLDLALLLCMSPGLLFVREQRPLGYVWLFVVSSILLLRLCADSHFQRRPRLEPNMNPAGLAFLAASTFAFLMTNVVTSPPPASTVQTVRRGDDVLHMRDSSDVAAPSEGGPASTLIAATVVPLSSVVAPGDEAVAPGPGIAGPGIAGPGIAGPGIAGPGIAGPGIAELIAARIMVVLAHMAVIAGLFCVGRNHFGDSNVGLAMGALYLMLPCTAYDVGRVNHVLPAALVVWALVAYRRPMAAGSLLGLACGTLFFPVFLLPLWAAFYGRRGALRFGLALGLVAAVLLGSMVLTSADRHSFTRQTIGSIDWSLLEFRDASQSTGFWSIYDPAYRIPVFVAFAVMLVFLTVWPRKKSLEELAAHSTAIIVGIQFWYPQQGGIYLLWYLPLMLVVAFRPRLAHLGPPVIPARQAGAEPRPDARELTATGTTHRPLYR